MRRDEKKDIAWDYIIWLIIVGVVVAGISTITKDPIESSIHSLEWTVLVSTFFIIKAIQRGPQ